MELQAPLVSNASVLATGEDSCAIRANSPVLMESRIPFASGVFAQVVGVVQHALLAN